MSGRRASFPPPASAPPRSPESLRFEVPVQNGKNANIAFDDRSRPQLVRAFTAALHDSLTAPGVVCTPTKVRTHAEQLRRFFQFLDATNESVDTIAALEPRLFDRYEAWLKRHTMAGAIYRRHLLSRPILLLRRMEEQKPGSLPPVLLPRLAYLSLEPCKNSRPRDAYSGTVAARIRRAARKQVVDAARRIVLGDELPHPPADVHPTVSERFQQLVEGIARDGWAMSKEPLFDSMRQRAIYHGAPRRKDLSCAAVHARFYLTATDVVAFIILISLGTGMEIECLRALRADCLKNPARGFVDIAYFKRRAHGTEWKTIRVRDGGMMTPGGLLRLAIRLTERARRRLGSDLLWVWGCLNGLIDGMSHGSLAARYFVRDHGLVDDQGNVLRLELSRLRKTYKAAWYLKTGGQLETFAQGHSVEVAAQHYADIPALRHVHEATIAAALDEALAAVQPNEPRIFTPSQEAAIRRDPDAADLAAVIATRDVVPLLNGAQDVWLAACANFYDSPFGKPDQACTSPFWACLDCRNAVITVRKLPALIAFMNFTLEQRGLLASEDWEAKFGQAWRRINDQILPAFPRSVVELARKNATAELLYLPPEASAP